MKSRTTAAILAIFLGGLGIHKFYMGKAIGLVYLLFCWTYIPAIIALVEGILYFSATDNEFQVKYIGKSVERKETMEQSCNISSNNGERSYSSIKKKLP